MGVTDVGSTGASSTAGTAAQAKNRQFLDKDSFMKLFVTQMKNQDPLKPMDGQDMAAQLAQFSSLEQLYNLNDKLNNLMAYGSSQNNLQALSLIDKYVQAKSDSITLQGGKTGESAYEIDGNATSRILKILDKDGNCVRKLNLGGADSGRYALNWDGRSDRGQMLPDGIYTYEVFAMNGHGEQLPVNTCLSDRITSVSFDNGVSTLGLAGGQHINISDITKIINPPTQ